MRPLLPLALVLSTIALAGRASAQAAAPSSAHAATSATARSATAAAARDTTHPLPRSTPEAQGISAAALLAFVEAADSQIDAMNSFMLLRHGQVVAEGWWAPYDARTPHVLYSLSKSFTSTAVGLAAADGRFSIYDRVLKFFPEDAPPDPSANLRANRS